MKIFRKNNRRNCYGCDFLLDWFERSIIIKDKITGDKVYEYWYENVKLKGDLYREFNIQEEINKVNQRIENLEKGK